MKNIFSLIILFFLVNAFILFQISCSPIPNSIPKPVINNNVIDLGYKNNAEVTLKLSFTDRGFNTKVLTDGIYGQLSSIDHINIVLSKQGPVVTTIYANPVITFTINSPVAASTNIKIKGLDKNQNYYIAAKAFANAGESINLTSSDGTALGTGGGTAGSYNSEYINVDTNGIPSIVNDGTPPSTPGVSNFVIDLSLQLRADQDASILNTGNISFNEGIASFSTELTSLYKSLGIDFGVNTTQNSNQQKPSVAMNDNGNYVVVWQDDANDTNLSGVYAQLFTSEGLLSGNEFLVNATVSSDQMNPVVAMDGTGKFTVVWESESQDVDFSKGIYANCYNAIGSITNTEIHINNTNAGTQQNPAIARNANGDFVIAWESNQNSNYEIYARKYDNTCSPIGNEFKVNDTGDDNFKPSVAITATGEFVIAWENITGGDRDIYVKPYDNLQTQLSSEVKVNQVDTGVQQEVSVGIDSTQKFVVAWESDQNSNYDIYARKFNINATPFTKEFIVNNTIAGDQQNPYISMSGNGDFVISWESNLNSQDTSSFGIFARQFEENTNSEDYEFIVNSEILNSQNNSNVAINNKGKMTIVWESDDSNFRGVFLKRFSKAWLSGDGKFLGA